jgi:hypothetical protein
MNARPFAGRVSPLLEQPAPATLDRASRRTRAVILRYSISRFPPYEYPCPNVSLIFGHLVIACDGNAKKTPD